MPRLARVVILAAALVLSLGLPSLQAAPAPSQEAQLAQSLVDLAGLEPGAARSLARSFLAGTATPAVVQQAFRSAAVGTAREAASRAAGALEAPGTSVGYEAGLGRRVPVGKDSADATVSVGTSGYGGQVSYSGVSYSVNADPGSRALSATAAVGKPMEVPLGAGKGTLTVQSVVRAEFNYADNRSFASAAVGADAANLPGGKLTMQVLDALAGRKSPPSGPSTSPARTAVDAVLDTAFPTRGGFMNTESVVMGEGLQISVSAETPSAAGTVPAAEGGVKVTLMSLERVGPGQKAGQGTRYVETSLGLDLGGGAGTYKGGLGLSVSRTTDPAKQAADPRALELARALRSDDFQKVTRAVEEGSAVLWARDQVRRGLERVESREQGVGGVRLYFDPDILVRSAPPDRLVTALRDLADAPAGQPVLLLPEAGGDLVAVNLGAAVQEGARDLSHTSLRGCLAEPGGGFWLLGTRVPGEPPLSLDDLGVALRMVWLEGRSPAISLDPAPPVESYPGPQWVRTVDIPSDLRDTAFVKTLVDADYAMKRIMVGDDRPEVPGFVSRVDILARDRPSGSVRNRFWFYPSDGGGAEICEVRSGTRTLLTFDSGVVLLTERSRQAWEPASLEQGGVDPAAAEAVAEFNDHFDSLARERPILRRLESAFELARLASVLRLRGVDHPALRQAAARTPARVPLAASYPGLGPSFVPGTFAAGVPLTIAGGAVCTRPLDAGRAMALDGEVSLEGNRARLDLPAAVSLDASQAAQAEARVLVSRARSHLARSQVGEALGDLDGALALDPGSLEARAYRAKALFLAGRPREGLADAKALPEDHPRVRALRGALLLYCGEPAAGVAELEAAVKSDPEEPDFLGLLAMAQVFDVRFAAARDTLARLRRLDPSSGALDLVGNLAGRLEPLPLEQARAAATRLAELPYPTLTALKGAFGTSETGDTRDALDQVRLAQADLAGLPASVEVGFARDTCRLSEALLLVQAEEFGPARAILDPLNREHPEWVLPAVLLASLDYEESPDRGLSAWLGLLARDPRSDPFVVLGPPGFGEEMVVQTGAAMVLKSALAAVEGDGVPTPAQVKDLHAASEALASRLPEGPARDFFRAVEIPLGMAVQMGPEVLQEPPPGVTFRGRSVAQVEAEVQALLEGIGSARLSPESRLADIRVTSWRELRLAGGEIGEAGDFARAFRLLEGLGRCTRGPQEADLAAEVIGRVQTALLMDLSERLPAASPALSDALVNASGGASTARAVEGAAESFASRVPPAMPFHRDFQRAEATLRWAEVMHDRGRLDPAARRAVVAGLAPTLQGMVASARGAVEEKVARTWLQSMLPRLVKMGADEVEALEIVRRTAVLQARLDVRGVSAAP